MVVTRTAWVGCLDLSFQTVASVLVPVVLGGARAGDTGGAGGDVCDAAGPDVDWC